MEYGEHYLECGRRDLERDGHDLEFLHTFVERPDFQKSHKFLMRTIVHLGNCPKTLDFKSQQRLHN